MTTKKTTREQAHEDALELCSDDTSLGYIAGEIVRLVETPLAPLASRHQAAAYRAALIMEYATIISDRLTRKGL